MAFTYGDAVRVTDAAPQKYKPGSVASVIGWREASRRDLGISPNDQSMVLVIHVEYGDGSDNEVPQKYLEPYSEEAAK